MNVLECGKLFKMEYRMAVEDQEEATLTYRDIMFIVQYGVQLWGNTPA